MNFLVWVFCVFVGGVCRQCCEVVFLCALLLLLLLLLLAVAVAIGCGSCRDIFVIFLWCVHERFGQLQISCHGFVGLMAAMAQTSARGQ